MNELPSLLGNWTAGLILILTSVLLSNVGSAQEETERVTAAAVETAVDNAIDFASQSVVQIETVGGLASPDDASATGPFTGTVISSDGRVLTASYNLRHDPGSIFVRLGSERMVAEVVAKDTSRKLTLLKIESDDLVPVLFGDVNTVAQGQRVIAVGKSLSATEPNVSVGIVSATGRVWSRAIQTDCKVSRQNYGGPLVTLTGEVLGILVPLSPNSEEVAAGADWYDSGIGFASIVDVDSEPFQKLKQGTTISRGRMGVTFEGPDENADPAKVSFCLPTSPAGKAGIEVGDTIVEANGRKIVRQAQFKHVIGCLYAGQKLNLTVLKSGSEERIERVVELAAEIDPYIEPELGLLFDRSKKGLVIEAIVPGSPAEDTELQIGDVIESVNGVVCNDVQGMREIVSRMVVGESCKLVFTSDQASMVTEVVLRRQTAAPIPDMPRRTVEATKVETISLVVAEGANKCVAFVPGDGADGGDGAGGAGGVEEVAGEEGKASPPKAVLVWVPAPGPVDGDAMLKKFAELVKKHDVIVIVPESVDPESWLPDDASVIARSLDQLQKQIKFDPERVAIAGRKTGARMALLTAFSNRSKFRGCVLADAELTTQLPNLTALPSQRLHLMVMAEPDSEDLEEVQKGVELFFKKGFSVHLETGPNSSQLETLFQWLSTLDRL
jgi:serine protease Do